jgi:hypothetical protein
MVMEMPTSKEISSSPVLAHALTTREKRKNFDGFLKSVRSIKRAKVAKSSEEMVREPRQTESILPNA